ncbi:type II secretion system protein GspL [Agitococcus lubricus]|uniref:Type II secretion system protein L n=1 Tax=Agitococcus lubricus TaxID=1077255 RepID=A0A2T5IWI6_9GAMM|nr:type II secretion system protein GspL [Agitococcus lubricus]PTQ88285.1 type II secretion system protein L [Agitococcus lubricus]
MDNLFIRIPTLGGLWQGWSRHEQTLKALSEADLEALMSAGLANVAVTVLVPTSLCLFSVVHITRQQLKQLQPSDMALLLEDQTLSPVEQLHCVCRPLNDEQAVIVGIQQQTLQSLLEPFTASQCQLVAAIPDIFMVPSQEHSWSLLVDNSDCWLRINPHLGLRLEATAAIVLLNSAWQEYPTQRVSVYGDVPSDVQAWLSAKQDLTIDVVPAVNWTQEFQQLNAKHAFNLLTGKFTVKTASSLSGYWRYAAIFVGIAFATQLAYDSARLWHFKKVAQQTKTQSIQLYQSLFPQEQRIVNLKRQIESHLAERQQMGQGFMPIATRVGEVLNTQQWQTQRIDFDSNGLLLEVDAANLTELDKLRQQLNAQGLVAETLSANSQGTGIRGRLRISESS